MAKLVGRWLLDSSDQNWEEYMKAMGTGFALRQIGKRISSTEEIKSGEKWSLKITSTFKNVHLIFTLGEEFDETTMDGRKVKSILNIEDDKLVHYQKATEVGVPDTVIVRELLDENTMAVTVASLPQPLSAQASVYVHILWFGFDGFLLILYTVHKTQSIKHIQSHIRERKKK